MKNFFGKLKDLNWEGWLTSLLGAGISAAASVISANPVAEILGAAQFTPRQLGIMALSSAIVAMAGILKKSPLPDRRVAIALLPGVHTQADVDLVAKNTDPGSTPTAEVAAAILAGTPPPTPPVVK